MARDDPRLFNGSARLLGAKGFTSVKSALERFRSFCQFDATTGCVLWTGGQTKGRGKTAPYGCFKDSGKAWKAHRWAAKHIHGLEIDGLHVDHCCDPWRAGGYEPLPQNTLCVQHVQALTNADNVTLMHERRTWILTQKGYLEPPPLFVGLEAPAEFHAVPFHVAPAWLGVDGAVNTGLDDCPF